MTGDSIRPATGDGDQRVGYRDPVLWAVIVLSVTLKLTLAVALNSCPPVMDERDYLHRAQILAAEGRYVNMFRPPLYAAFMAPMYMAGWDELGVRIGQVILSTASVVLVYRIARRTLNPSAARVAAGLVAFDPVLVMFTHRFWSETLFIFLLMAALDVLSLPSLPRKLWLWVLAGLLLGLAGLTRAMILTFVPLLLPWTMLQMRRQPPFAPTVGEGLPEQQPKRGILDSRRFCFAVGLRFVALGLGCSVVVLPWTLRNVYVSGALVVDTNGPFNLLIGTRPEAAFVDKDNNWDQRFGRIRGVSYHALRRKDPSAARRLAVRSALEHIKARPGLFVRKSLWEASHLWTLDSFLLRHLRNKWYERAVPSSFVVAITLVSVGFFIVLVLGGFAGLATQPASPLRGLVVLLTIHSTVLFGVVFSLSRFCLPLHALLAIPAAGVLSSPRRTLSTLVRAGLRSRGNLLLALVVVTLGWQWVRDAPLVHDMIFSGGAEHRFRVKQIVPPDRREGRSPLDETRPRKSREPPLWE